MPQSRGVKMSNSYKLDVGVSSGFPIETRSGYKESSRWEIEVTPLSKGIYGYGYGHTPFQTIHPPIPNGLDYFNVLGIDGLYQGYGIAGTEGTSCGSYTYGWGYEFGYAIAANTPGDEIIVRALVTENNIPQSGIKVIFLGSPGAILGENVAYTDSEGYAYTTISFLSALNTDFEGDSSDMPSKGYLTVKAIVDEKPGEEEGMATVTLSSEQLFYDSVVFLLNFDLSGVQHYGYGYGISI
jgi:hypothetical protein